MDGSLRLAGIIPESIVDGPGIRMTIFTQGCPHHCPGCHNPQTHDFNGGKDVSFDYICDILNKDTLISGVTFSGGEPFCQAKELARLVDIIKPRVKNIITYSGYTYEQITESDNPDFMELLKRCDFLIDGRYEQDKRSLMLNFRGSTNQRIIDIKQSLLEGHAIITEL
ncbi:MAG: anaerobic ribonucleoside-triphosphate reductase activating protein [Bacillota bacterium]|nr:anaerobic ribonucleoside-triphosphate reductase activating protein [Bacillota bacterium]